MSKNRTRKIGKTSWTAQTVDKAHGKWVLYTESCWSIPFPHFKWILHKAKYGKKNCVCSRCRAQQVRRVVLQYAERPTVMHNFNKCNRTAGHSSQEGFLTKNGISVRRLQVLTELLLSTKQMLFYPLLWDLMEKYNFVPENIYMWQDRNLSKTQGKYYP